MLFNSWTFFLFFPVTTALYYLLPYRFRWLLLLAASCLFYMAFVPMYILILAFVIVADYWAGIRIEEAQGKSRRLFLGVSIAANCSVLFLFKYFNFVNGNLAGLADLLHWNYSVRALSLALPIGLSFHTFQSLSYIIEVYRGNQKAERDFGIYALYVMFYPQLVAGPIERPQNLLHQFHEDHDFDYPRVVAGLRLMAWGLFKKVVIADRLAPFVNTIYSDPRSFNGPSLVAATVLFAIQIYCDFSGYSDIALGAAKVLGYELMLNFDRPYSAQSLSEFWKRWHISLSTWLRDYVYTPIAVEKRDWGAWGVVFAIMITFFISGFWHGAAWTFALWGLLHGFGLSVEALTGKWRKRLSKTVAPKLYNGLSWLTTFSFVTFTYIFFRANNVTDAFYIATHLNHGWRQLMPQVTFIAWGPFRVLGPDLGFQQPSGQLWLAAFAIGLLEFVHWRRQKEGPPALAGKPWWVRWPMYYCLVASLLVFGVWFTKRSFIYFQF